VINGYFPGMLQGCTRAPETAGVMAGRTHARALCDHDIETDLSWGKRAGDGLRPVALLWPALPDRQGPNKKAPATTAAGAPISDRCIPTRKPPSAKRKTLRRWINVKAYEGSSDRPENGPSAGKIRPMADVSESLQRAGQACEHA
jgi:hypothetical protein